MQITIKKWDRTDSQVKEQGHRPAPSVRYLPSSMSLHHWVRFQTTCRVFTLWVVWNRSVISSTSQSWSFSPEWVIHVLTWSPKGIKSKHFAVTIRGWSSVVTWEWKKPGRGMKDCVDKSRGIVTDVCCASDTVCSVWWFYYIRIILESGGKRGPVWAGARARGGCSRGRGRHAGMNEWMSFNSHL